MTTEEAIREVLSRGPHSERSLVDALRGLLGEEPDDWGDVRDELVDKGEVVYETDEYHQTDTYSLAERPVPTKQLANNAVEIAEVAQRAGEVSLDMREAFTKERAAEAELLAETLATITPHLDAILSLVQNSVRSCRLLRQQRPDGSVVELHIRQSTNGDAALSEACTIAWQPISERDACERWKLSVILAALCDAFDRVANGNAARRAEEARERAEMLGAITLLVRGMRAQPPKGAGKSKRKK